MKAETHETYDDGISGSAITLNGKCWQRVSSSHGVDEDAAELVRRYNLFHALLEFVQEDRPAPIFADYTCRRHAKECPCCEWRARREILIAKMASEAVSTEIQCYLAERSS